MSKQTNASINIYHRHGCVGCCLCEGGAQKVKRQTVLWTIALFTCGFGLLILPFYKKCLYCGHNTFMNKHRHNQEE